MRVGILAVVIAMTVLLRLPAPGAAAEIDVAWDGGLAFIIVAGEFERGDEIAFRKAISGISTGVVILDGPGGNLQTGLAIGEAIRLRHLGTAVVSGGTRTSACALAWLAGATRFKSRLARIGFHAAWIEDGGVNRETGAGNALVGAYLSSFGLSKDAVLFATLAGPDEIAWLTEEIAEAVGIEFAPLDDEPGSPAIERDPAADDGLVAEARRFVHAHFAEVGAPGDRYRRYAEGAYAERVRYHGRLVSRLEVLDDLARFVDRWPDRRYRPWEDLTIRCDRQRRTCTVERIGAYAAASDARRQISNGRFTFAMEVRFDGRPSILAEESTVVDRTIADMAPGGGRLVAFIQANLTRIGCDPGAIDGAWGSSTARAIDRFNRRTGASLSVDGPSIEALGILELAEKGDCVPSVGVPRRSVSLLPERDLPVGDYRMVKDVPYGSCESACLADHRCAAFTFDRRNEWCFLKDRVASPVDYKGAISGIVRQGTITVRPVSR